MLGTTASGKTAYGIELANQLNGEIINCDSMQVYREIPILGAQPSADELNSATHHLYSIISCLDKFDVKKWIDLIVPLIHSMWERGKHPILVGGTGMYVKALVEGIAYVPEIDDAIRNELNILSTEEIYQRLQAVDPRIAAQLKANDRQRLSRALEVKIATGESLLFWHAQPVERIFQREIFNMILVERNREEIYERINKRFLLMIENGAILEVQALMEKIKLEQRSLLPKACGLNELIDYLLGDISLNDAIKLGQQSSRNYAKRQYTWMRNQVDFDRVV